MTHESLVNTCIAELAARKVHPLADLQRMDVNDLMKVASEAAKAFVPFIPAEGNDAANLPSASSTEEVSDSVDVV